MDDVRKDLAALRALVEQQQQRIAELEGRLAARAKPDPVGGHTRRQLLAGAAAAVAGGAAAVAGSPARAADGDPLKVGNTTSATSQTVLTFDGSISSTTAGLAVSEGTLGSVDDSAAVLGYSKGGFDAGVYGFNDGDGYGVTGLSTVSTGVFGLGSEAGVVGLGSSFGVGGVTLGSTPKNIALVGETISPLATALAVVGVHRASRTGTATVPAGKRFVKVNLNPISSASLIFATLQPYGGTLAVAGVIPGPNFFTIYLTAPAPRGVKVGWFVVDKLGTILKPEPPSPAEAQQRFDVRSLAKKKIFPIRK